MFEIIACFWLLLTLLIIYNVVTQIFNINCCCINLATNKMRWEPSGATTKTFKNLKKYTPESHLESSIGLPGEHCLLNKQNWDIAIHCTSTRWVDVVNSFRMHFCYGMILHFSMDIFLLVPSQACTRIWLIKNICGDLY